MLAAAEIARHAQWLRMGIDDDHRVEAIFVAAATVIFNGLSSSILAGRHH